MVKARFSLVDKAGGSRATRCSTLFSGHAAYDVIANCFRFTNCLKLWHIVYPATGTRTITGVNVMGFSQRYYIS